MIALTSSSEYVASTALPTPEATIATRPPTLVSERMISRLSMRVSTMMNSSSTTARLAVSRVRARNLRKYGTACAVKLRRRGEVAPPLELRARACHFHPGPADLQERGVFKLPRKGSNGEGDRPGAVGGAVDA